MHHELSLHSEPRYRGWDVSRLCFTRSNFFTCLYISSKLNKDFAEVDFDYGNWVFVSGYDPDSKTSVSSFERALRLHPLELSQG